MKLTLFTYLQTQTFPFLNGNFKAIEIFNNIFKQITQQQRRSR